MCSSCQMKQIQLYFKSITELALCQRHGHVPACPGTTGALAAPQQTARSKAKASDPSWGCGHGAGGEHQSPGAVHWGPVLWDHSAHIGSYSLNQLTHQYRKHVSSSDTKQKTKLWFLVAVYVTCLHF